MGSSSTGLSPWFVGSSARYLTVVGRESLFVAAGNLVRTGVGSEDEHHLTGLLSFPFMTSRIVQGM